MDHSVTFARHFARLLWLLLNEPQNLEEQKSALRALVAVSRDGPVTLSPAATGITANGHPVAASIPGVTETAKQLAVHHARELIAHAAASAADVLQAARILASDQIIADPADERLRASGATTVHLSPERSSVSGGASFDGFELLSDDVLAVSMAQGRPSRELPSASGTAGTTSTGLFSQFASLPARSGYAALLADLASVPDEGVLGVLDRVALAAEQAQRAGDGPLLTMLLVAVIRREARAAPEWGRDFAIAMRRMAVGPGLRLVAAQLPRRAVPRDDIQLILARSGDEGAEAVIDLLAQAQSAGDRRAYFDMLLSLRAGIPALIHMLGDARWYVVRNAVELLAEMQVAEAEKAITALFTHEDVRVRTSATSALLRLDTPSSRAAVQNALRSTSPGVRQQAITALAMRKEGTTAATLLRALDREEDETVQRAIYAALGQVATADAVERLTSAAEPASGLFKRKAGAMRAAAAIALGDARTPAALAALRALSTDKDRDVRAAAQKALSNARGGGLGVTGVFERRV